MCIIQEANLKLFRSLYTRNSNYPQPEKPGKKRRKDLWSQRSIPEKSWQGRASDRVGNSLKPGVQEKRGGKKSGEKLRAKTTEALQSHTEGVLGKDPKEARGEERKGRLLTSCCQWRSVSGAEPWRGEHRLVYRSVSGNRQQALWSVTKRGSSKLACTGTREDAAFRASAFLPPASTATRQPRGCSDPETQPTNINYLFLDLGLIDERSINLKAECP